MKKGNRHLKIIAATSMSIFSLAAVFVASFAWFTVARNVDADGTGFVATQMDSIVEKVEFHKMSETNAYKYDVASALTYTIDKSQSSGYRITTGTASDEIAIGTYDSLSIKQSLLVLYTLKDDISTDNLKFKLSANTNITDKTFDDTILGANMKINQTDNSLSDVVQFYSFSYTTDESLPIDSEDSSLYDYSSDKEDIEDSDLTFVSVSSDNTATLANTSLSLVDNSEARNIKYIAIIMTYNEDAMSMIYSKYIGSEVLSSDKISFTTDFKLVI